MIPERVPINSVKNEYNKNDLIINDDSFLVGNVDKYMHKAKGTNSPISIKTDGRIELYDV